MEETKAIHPNGDTTLTFAYELDPNKSQKNKEKHGIDFVEALWGDRNAPLR